MAYKIVEIYPRTEIVKKESQTTFKARKQWTGGKIISSEGIALTLFGDCSISEMTFVVLNVKQMPGEKYLLSLHSHGEGDNDCIEAGIELSLDMLKAWTELNSRDIENAFRSLSLGYSYNLILSLPRIIEVTEEAIIVKKGKNQIIDAFNACNYLLQETHPLDN